MHFINICTIEQTATVHERAVTAESTALQRGCTLYRGCCEACSHSDALFDQLPSLTSHGAEHDQ